MYRPHFVKLPVESNKDYYYIHLNLFYVYNYRWKHFITITCSYWHITVGKDRKMEIIVDATTMFFNIIGRDWIIKFKKKWRKGEGGSICVMVYDMNCRTYILLHNLHSRANAHIHKLSVGLIPLSIKETSIFHLRVVCAIQKKIFLLWKNQKFSLCASHKLFKIIKY